MEEGKKEKVVLGAKKLKFNKLTNQFARLDCVEGGPTGFTEKHYLSKEVEIPKDVDVFCVYYYEK